MIAPIYTLLQQLGQEHRTGMLLLVVMTSGSASHIVTLWFRGGELFHASDRMRRGASALLLLQHVRNLRRWQWFELTAPADLKQHELPSMADFLQFQQESLVPAEPEGAPVTLEQLRMERLFAIHAFMQTMGGVAGDDAFMQLLFAHPPFQYWDELVEACREHIAVYFGLAVAQQVVDG